MTELACAGCGSTEHLIVDDGRPICRVCVMRWGDAAGFPDRLPATILRELAECHRGVVAYRGPGGRVPAAWLWRERT